MTPLPPRRPRLAAVLLLAAVLAAAAGVAGCEKRIHEARLRLNTDRCLCYNASTTALTNKT